MKKTELPFSPVRITARNNDNKPTSLIKIEAETNDAYNNAIANRVKIGFTNHRAEPARSIIQCYNCQKTGHTSKSCTNKQVCLKCGGSHTHQQCQATTNKCANCKGDHPACSRKCNYLRTTQARVNNNVKPTINESNNYRQQKQQSNTNTNSNSYASVTSSIPAQQNIKKQQYEENITETVDRVLARLNDLVTAMLDTYMEKVEKQIETSIKAATNLDQGKLCKAIFDSVHHKLLPTIMNEVMTNLKSNYTSTQQQQQAVQNKPTSSITITSTNNINQKTNNQRKSTNNTSRT